MYGNNLVIEFQQLTTVTELAQSHNVIILKLA